MELFFYFLLLIHNLKNFNIEFKIRNQPKVIPYIDVVEDTYNSALVYIKIYNETNVVAQNIGITINEEWLNFLSKDELKHTDIIREVGNRNNLYITNKQEHSYFLGNINEKEQINKGTIIITITYYEEGVKKEDLRKEDFVIDLNNILLKKENIYLANYLKNLDKTLEVRKKEINFLNESSHNFV